MNRTIKEHISFNFATVREGSPATWKFSGSHSPNDSYLTIIGRL